MCSADEAGHVDVSLSRTDVSRDKAPPRVMDSEVPASRSLIPVM